MSRDPKEYGWYLTSGGAYEPMQTLDAIAPMNLIKLGRCNCSGDCTTRRCYCKNKNVKCIAACGTYHENQCKNNDDETIDSFMIFCFVSVTYLSLLNFVYLYD